MIAPYELTILAAAIMPCFIFVWLLDRYDRFKKEPRRLLIKLLVAGMVSVVAAILIELPLGYFLAFLPEKLVVPAEALLGVAVPEEAVKLAAVMIVVRRRDEFDELLDGAVYGVTAAMGFALLENILYVFGSEDAMSVALLRGFTAIPLHALAGGFMGLAIARFRIVSKGSIGSGFLIAVLIHGLYDWFLMDTRVPGWPILPILVIGWWILIRQLRKARKEDCLAGRHIPDERLLT